MVAQNGGSITLNGITDQELIEILETKKKHASNFFFAPQSLNPVNDPNNRTQYYNNVQFNWNGEAGLQAVHELLGKLMRKEKAAGQ